MIDARVREMQRKLTQDGGPFDYAPDHSRLLLRVQRGLAKGRPVSGGEVDQIIAELGIARDGAHRFLREITERDAEDNIVGILGLSLNSHPHRFYLNGRRMSAWCAEDTLFLPAMLKQTASVESSSPVTREKIRLTVSPQGVEHVSPAGAVLSIVIVDPDTAEIDSAQAIWSTFCCHIHFFTSREEAQQWAGARDDIAILSVDEGFELGQQFWSKVLAYAE